MFAASLLLFVMSYFLHACFNTTTFTVYQQDYNMK